MALSIQKWFSDSSFPKFLDPNNKLIEVKKMSKGEKNTTVKAIVKAEVPVKTVNPIKPVPAKHIPAKHIPAKHIPAVHVLTTFEDLMENFRNSFIESIAFPWNWVSLEPVVPAIPVREATVDLVDEGNRFVVHAELPGVAKDKIDVMLTKDGIEISAETDVEKEDKAKNFDFVVRERVYTHVYKQLAFPEEVIPEQAESTFKDGLLSVYIPKKTIAPAPKKHKVAVK
jgi:HSP20 family molecular chaperone IbpA